MPSKKIKTLDMKEYQRNYQRIYYRKNIKRERQRCREYYHKHKEDKGFMKPPMRANTHKVDDKINGLIKTKGNFKITFN
tara:strand:- start:87 stop:323 length:237 start_codon:yes stop_codon:yes gene_type:complete